MKIILNNKTEEITGFEKITVTELLKFKNFTFKMLVVRINNRIIKKEEFDESVIYEGDNVMVLHLISGG